MPKSEIVLLQRVRFSVVVLSSASICHPVGSRLENWLLEEGWLMTRGQQPFTGSSAPAFGSVFWKICFSLLCQPVCPPVRVGTVLFTSIPAFTPMLGQRGGFTGGSMVKNLPAMQETHTESPHRLNTQMLYLEIHHLLFECDSANTTGQEIAG